VGLSRRDWLARALALGAAGTAGTASTAGTGAGCGVPVAPQPDGKRTTPRRVVGAGAGERVIAPGGVDPMSAPEWRGDADPFTLGVASGLSASGLATIWTRLAPRPLENGGGLDPVPLRVRWEVLEAEGTAVLRSGVVLADPAWAHSVRVELEGLAPGRAYRYRFASGAAASPVGRLRTAPAAGEGDRLRAVFASYQAYFDHMPLPWSMAPAGASMRLYGHLDWGGLARVHALDDRQYRSQQACSPPGFAGSRVVGPDCEARLDPARTMLGAEQEAWLDGSLRGARMRWNLLAQQTLTGPRDQRTGPEEGWWTDGWDGYPAARQRLLESVRVAGARNPIALGGDVHAFHAGELHEDFDRPQARAAMIEFVGGSITSQGPSQARVDALLGANPNLRWGAGGVNGYGLINLSRRGASVSLRGIGDATDRATGVRTLRRFEIRDGSGRLEG
jgi:alkaline phosphatase D